MAVPDAVAVVRAVLIVFTCCRGEEMTWLMHCDERNLMSVIDKKGVHCQ